jgi:hypothetical protein
MDLQKQSDQAVAEYLRTNGLVAQGQEILRVSCDPARKADVDQVFLRCVEAAFRNGFVNGASAVATTANLVI